MNLYDLDDIHRESQMEGAFQLHRPTSEMKDLSTLVVRVLLLNNLQRVVAITLGVLAGGLTMGLVEVWAMHAIFDLPDTMMENTSENVSDYLTQIPLGAQWTIAGSHLIGALIASWLAYRIGQKDRLVAIVAGGVIAVMTLTHIYGVVHPVWMSWVMPLAAGLGLWLGSILIPRLRGRAERSAGTIG